MSDPVLQVRDLSTSFYIDGDWHPAVRGRVGVHDRQSLVLVNFGGGTGAELLALAEEISDSVQQKFAVALEIEPTIYPAPVKKPL